MAGTITAMHRTHPQGHGSIRAEQPSMSVSNGVVAGVHGRATRAMCRTASGDGFRHRSLRISVSGDQTVESLSHATQLVSGVWWR